MGRCQEHLIESRRKELAVLHLEQGRSQRANGLPVIRYSKDCSDAEGIDLSLGSGRKYSNYGGGRYRETGFNKIKKRNLKKILGGGHILWHVGSWFPNQGSNPGLLPCSMESQ